MRRPLNELISLQKQLEVPIVVAGDVFHTWRSSAELINFALEVMPEVYAIPGNHDLPQHNYDNIKKSAYWTLVEAGRVHNLPPGQPWCPRSCKSSVYFYGYPPGFQPKRSDRDDRKGMHVAVCHEYVWEKGHTFPGALVENNVAHARQRLKGFDAAVFGDNHKGFLNTNGKPHICNVGSMMRRNSDQVFDLPAVWVLHDDGTFLPKMLDTDKDVLLVTLSQETPELNALPLVELLQSVPINDLDFPAAAIRWMDQNSVKGRIRQIVLEILETCNQKSS